MSKSPSKFLRFCRVFNLFNVGYLLMITTLTASSLSDPLTLALQRGNDPFGSDAVIVSLCVAIVAFTASFCALATYVEKTTLRAKFSAGLFVLYAILQLVAFGLFVDRLVPKAAPTSGFPSRRPPPSPTPFMPQPSVQLVLILHVLGRAYDLFACTCSVYETVLIHRETGGDLNAVPMQMHVQPVAVAHLSSPSQQEMYSARQEWSGHEGQY